MPGDRIPKLIMEWIPRERSKSGRPRKTGIKGVQAAMTKRNLEPDQRRNKEEWRLVSGRQRQIDRSFDFSHCLYPPIGEEVVIT